MAVEKVRIPPFDLSENWNIFLTFSNYLSRIRMSKRKEKNAKLASKNEAKTLGSKIFNRLRKTASVVADTDFVTNLDLRTLLFFFHSRSRTRTFLSTID